LNTLSTLRLRIFLGISIVSLIVLTIVGYRAYVEWQLRVEYARTRVQNTAQRIAAAHNDTVQYTAGLIDSLARVAAVSHFAASEKCSLELAKELTQSPHFAGISVLLPSGVTICSAGASQSLFNAIDTPYFRRALTSPRLVIGEVLYGKSPGKFALPFYKSVFGDAPMPSAIIVVLVDLVAAAQELGKANLPETTRVGVVDAKGSLLALHPIPKGWVTRDISKSALFDAIRNAREDQTFVQYGLDGEPRVYGTARFADTDAGPLTLFVSMPRSVALSEVRNEFALPLAITLLMIVLTFVAAAVGVDRVFLRPARAVAEAARRFAAGDMSARTGLPHDRDELGQLAQSFDVMADSLEAEKRRTELANRALHQLHDALRRIPAAIAYVDKAQHCLYANRAYESWFGVASEQMKAMTLRDLLGRDTYSRVQEHVQSALRGEPQRFEMPFPDVGGGLRQAAVSYLPDVGPTGVAGFFIFANDITDHKRQTEAFAKLAHVDALTGLPNRLTFMELLDRSYKRAQRDGTSLAVLFIDLDGLKEINDTLGHGMGDTVLKAFAQKVRASVRAVDVVARLGGDEFTVLIDDLRNPNAVHAVVDKLEAALRTPMLVSGHSIVVSASIGVAQRRARETTPEEIIAAADAEMYRVKNRRKGHS
jgi:diguanylate cyclase (GGDEF)-like protein/PAS domain S-box-containing protein